MKSARRSSSMARAPNRPASRRHAEVCSTVKPWVLGVHCFGYQASEIVHIGQAILGQPGETETP